ncbi:MAG: hypothetical protein F2744_04625 [Actinobacteria bacterium]|uniref:Unannotated protein n=1 Tax=freshwater metagenome TaxID=449393 RepID=A0A6J6YI97_9ZZZZ|nr:hypothetical protein [Actinomycetota bacterium]
MQPTQRLASSKSVIWLRIVGLAPGRLCRAAILLGLGAFIAAAYLPGSVVPDTLDMCAQAVSGVYNDWHSPAIAGLWGFFNAPIEAIFLLTLTSTIVAIHLILTRWLRPWVAVACTAAIMLFPATVGWMGHVGKDEWFAAAFLLGTALIARAGTERRVRLRRALLLGVMICFWLAIAARKNALLPVGAALLVAWPVPGTIFGHLQGRPLVRRTLAAGAVLVLLVGSVSVFTSVVVRPRALHPEQQAFLFDLTGISLDQGQMLFPPDTFPSGTTLAEIDQVYDEKTGDVFFFAPGSPANPFMPAEQVSAVKEKWLEAVLNHPDDYLSTRLSYTSALLGISGPHPYWSINDPGSLPAKWGSPCRVPNRTFPSLHERVLELLLRVERGNLFRAWTFLVILIAGSLLAGLRKVTEARVLLLGGLLFFAGIAVAGISPTFRYSWFVAVCALVAAALALRRIPFAARPDPPAEPPVSVSVSKATWSDPSRT